MTIHIEAIEYTWHVIEIAIDKDGEVSFVVHEDKAFPSKGEAERDARDRAGRYLREHFGIGNGDIRWDVSDRSPPKQ